MERNEESKARKERAPTRVVVCTSEGSKGVLTMYQDNRTEQYTVYAQYRGKNKQGEIRLGVPLLWYWSNDKTKADKKFAEYEKELK